MTTESGDTPIEVVVAARHGLFRRSVVVMLEGSEHIEVVAEAGSMAELALQYPLLLPDVVLAAGDLGPELEAGVRRLAPRAVLAAVPVGELDRALSLLAAGAHAVHWAEDLLVNGLETVITVYKGGTSVPDELAARLGAVLAPIATSTLDGRLCEQLVRSHSVEVAAMELGLGRIECGRRLRNLLGRLQVASAGPSRR